MRSRRWQLPVALAVLVPALLAGWTVTAVVAAEPSPGASPGAEQAVTGDPQKGAQIYGSQGCTACHGASLEGGIGPKLNPIVKLPGVENPQDAAFIKQVIRSGRSGDPGFSAAMPAFGPDKISDQDLNDLTAYIVDTNKKGPAGLGPVQLARSNVFWVTLAVSLLVLATWLLARYNMRWVDRRAAARRERGRRV